MSSYFYCILYYTLQISSPKHGIYPNAILYSDEMVLGFGTFLTYLIQVMLFFCENDSSYVGRALHCTCILQSNGGGFVMYRWSLLGVRAGDDIILHVAQILPHVAQHVIYSFQNRGMYFFVMGLNKWL